VRRASALATAEMHSGFAALRSECPMDLPLRETRDLSEAARANVARIVDLWSELLRDSAGNGGYLFGDWGIVDAFYTPVATRFRSYGVDLAAYGDRGACADYVSALLSTPDFLEWEAQA
jgi:glutathione S-transferase